MQKRGINIWGAVGVCFLGALIIFFIYFALHKEVSFSPQEDIGFLSPLNKIFIKIDYRVPTHAVVINDISNYFIEPNITMFQNEGESI